MDLKFKNTGLAVKDVDLSKRTVEGYFASFGNKDSDGDIIVKGAFSKTIKENRPRIAHLLQHDITSPIGKLLELEEDAKGLRFVSQLSQSTKGRDTLILYQEGILKEHSIGFNIVKGDTKEDHYEIQETKLWEGSTVTLGANANTPVLGIKSLGEQTKEAVERLERIERVLKHGNLTDESFRLLEFECQVVKNILSLEIKEPVPETTPPIDEPTLEINFVEQFKNLDKNG